jgi:glucans biosynthesis protein
MARPTVEEDGCGSVPPDIMAMGLRLLALYLRRLDPEGDDGRPPAARARRTRAAAAPADSCGARLRDGSPCLRPPVEGRRRCRSHGCAPRTGAPEGNRNARKHGRFTAKELAYGRRISEFIRESRETMQVVDRMTRRSRTG